MVEHDTLARPATTNSSISDGEVASIRRLHAAGMSGYRIAQIFPASYGAIKAYIRGDRRRAKDS